MTFPTSISAAQYSALAVSVDDVAAATAIATPTESNFVAAFATTADLEEIKNIRDMPSFGTPANIVKVPVYGQAQTQSIGAQADAPDLELTINYVPGDWAEGSTLGDMVGDGVAKVFQFSLLPSKPDELAAATTGLGTAPNANIYFIGRIESILVNPARDDASTATVALSIQSDFFGPFTVDPV